MISGGTDIRNSCFRHVLRLPSRRRRDNAPVGSYLGITSLAGVMLSGAVSASALVKLSGYSG
jgi:hypothetical protein